MDQILSEFSSLPKLGQESFARRYRREVGGGAAITACALSRLGVDVTVLGVIGKSDGQWMVDRLMQAGVDCSLLEWHLREPTGTTVSVSTREDRAFFSYYGANEKLAGLLKQKATLLSLARAHHVHFACAPDGDADLPLIAGLRRKAKISIDVQSHMSWLTRPSSLKILRQCDMFFPNEQEAEWISYETGTPQILHALRDKGARGVGLKLGGKGAALLWRRRQFLTDIFPVDTVDTTGAGDCFNAGFIYASLQGYPPQRCLDVANICGALSTRALGGIDGFPTLNELKRSEAELKRKS